MSDVAAFQVQGSNSVLFQTAAGGPGKKTIQGEFSASLIADWVKDITGRRLPTVVREIAKRLMIKIVALSPVDTGLFVSSWEISKGAPVMRGMSGGVRKFVLPKQVVFSASGKARVLERMRTMSGAHYVKMARYRSSLSSGDSKGDFGGQFAKAKKIGEVVAFFSGMSGNKIENYYITNSLPYAMRLEYGYSRTKAPHGMVRTTMQNAQEIVHKVIAEMGV